MEMLRPTEPKADKTPDLCCKDSIHCLGSAKYISKVKYLYESNYDIILNLTIL